MYISQIQIKNFRGIKDLELDLNPDINVFVGENNSGKTAIIDAIRYVLETTPFIKIEDSDFNDNESELSIKLTFSDLDDNEKALLLEYLTYDNDETIKFYLTLSAQNKTRNKWGYVEKSIKAGLNADIVIDLNVRDKIYSTYLKPLRDAKEELTSGNYSRLCQILDKCLSETDIKELNSKISNFNKDIKKQQDSKNYLKDIKEHLSNFIFENDNELSAEISLTAEKEENLFKGLLKKLNLEFNRPNQGLGYQNALYMAAELLLLKNKNKNEISSFLLIEEPEAHLHPQLQMKFLKYILELINSENYENKLQVFITTYSPNLASKINPEKIILSTSKDKSIQFWPLRKEETKLEKDDYVYLYKFLDTTKANMFFAKGIIMVEGPSEEILIPSIARAIGFNLEDFGVSVVNVNGVGYSRFANIFKRKKADEVISIPVAVIKDLDVKRYLFDQNKDLKKVRGKEKIPDMDKFLKAKQITDQKIRTFMSSYRALEIDLLNSSLKEMFIKFLEDNKKSIFIFKKQKKTIDIIFNNNCEADNFYKKLNPIKTDIAYHLANEIDNKVETCKRCDSSELNECMLSGLPKYLTDAIKYACGVSASE